MNHCTCVFGLLRTSSLFHDVVTGRFVILPPFGLTPSSFSPPPPTSPHLGIFCGCLRGLYLDAPSSMRSILPSCYGCVDRPHRELWYHLIGALLFSANKKMTTKIITTNATQLMIFQIQFLSVLRLVEANITAPFRHLLDHLKWLNLHFDIDLGIFSTCRGKVKGCLHLPQKTGSCSQLSQSNHPVRNG